MDTVVVNKQGCLHTVHTEEQLNTFLSAGWKIKKEPEKKEEPKVTKRKK